MSNPVLLEAIAVQSGATELLPDHIRSTGVTATEKRTTVSVPFDAVQNPQEDAHKTVHAVTKGGEDISFPMATELHERSVRFIGTKFFSQIRRIQPRW